MSSGQIVEEGLEDNITQQKENKENALPVERGRKQNQLQYAYPMVSSTGHLHIIPLNDYLILS